MKTLVLALIGLFSTSAFSAVKTNFYDLKSKSSDCIICQKIELPEIIEPEMISLSPEKGNQIRIEFFAQGQKIETLQGQVIDSVISENLSDFEHLSLNLETKQLRLQLINESREPIELHYELQSTL